MSASKPQIVITYCTQCQWLLRAAWLAQELLSTFADDLRQVALEPGTGGVFRITCDGVQIWERKADVLVCTTIVETGLDVSNANTLVVDRADRMGLSQLHQLRGRVGRGRERAYAFFLYPADRPLTETALQRLRTIATNTDLGAGMQVAMKDLIVQELQEYLRRMSLSLW